MRIKTLEEQLGQVLFIRTRAGARLTPAGEQFERHAAAMVRIWEQARHDVALPPGYQRILSVGAQVSLWDGFLLHWVKRLRDTMPGIALRAHLGVSGTLMQRMVDGTLDVAVMYTPQRRPGLEVESLLVDDLVLVSTNRRPEPDRDAGYVYVDWGPEFQADHMLNFPDRAVPGLFMELGSLGLRYILEYGGSGYFPRRVVMPHVLEKRLFLVRGAATFTYPAFLVYPAESDSDDLGPVLEGIRDAAILATKISRRTYT
jgi:DNA-binding transcriptional LysR family regulator